MLAVAYCSFRSLAQLHVEHLPSLLVVARHQGHLLLAYARHILCRLRLSVLSSAVGS